MVSADASKGTAGESKGRKQSRLYVYCIVPSTAPKTYGAIGIGGHDAPVQTIEYKDIAAVVSEVSDDHFEKTDENVLSHQRVVQKVFDKEMGVPLPFATVKENSDDVRQLLEESYDKFKDQLTKLGVFQSPGSQPASDETTGSTDLMSQVLEQSAASALKIRQMADELDEVRRKTYEKVMERVTEGAMKKLFDVLAHAPPGAVEIREAPSQPMQTVQMERLQKQLYELAEQLVLLVKVQGEKSEKEQQKLNDEIARLVAYNKDAMASVEKMLRGTFREYFDTVPPAMEDFVKRTVREYTEKTQRAYVKCIGCGTEVPDSYRFCPHCGGPTGIMKGEPRRVDSGGAGTSNEVRK